MIHPTHTRTGYQQAAVLGEHLAARLQGKRCVLPLI